jgi:hypothetical protein
MGIEGNSFTVARTGDGLTGKWQKMVRVADPSDNPGVGAGKYVFVPTTD